MSDQTQLQIRARSADSSLGLSNGRSSLVARGRRDAAAVIQAVKSQRVAGVLKERADLPKQTWPDIIATLKRDLETRKAAREGDPDAQFQVGWSYISGQEGAATDLGEALKWFRMSAEQGHAKAQEALGFSYKLGAEGPPDYVRAHMWLSLAAATEPRNAAARDAVAAEMSRAQITEAQGLAAGWYRSAADQGDPHAQYNLGLMYESGSGVEQDYVQAHTWMSRAAARASNPEYAAARDRVGGKMGWRRV